MPSLAACLFRLMRHCFLGRGICLPVSASFRLVWKCHLFDYSTYIQFCVHWHGGQCLRRLVPNYAECLFENNFTNKIRWRFLFSFVSMEYKGFSENLDPCFLPVKIKQIQKTQWHSQIGQLYIYKMLFFPIVTTVCIAFFVIFFFFAINENRSIALIRGLLRK